MNVQKVKIFWIEEAEEALQVMQHLFEKKDYSYSLFFAHLAVEKFLKAIFVVRKKEQPPRIHNLNRLADMAGIQLTEEQEGDLIEITAFNLESRYPDETRSFRKVCTKEFTKKEMERVEKVCLWVKSML